MEGCRFGKFILTVEGIHKSVQKIKLTEGPRFGMKGVHLLWMYELLMCPEGIAASELAERSNINRSLVSRELETLKKNGYITTASSGRGGYNAKIILTDKGKEVAERIGQTALEFQHRVDEDITAEELISFYATLDKIHNSLSQIASEDVSDTSLDGEQLKIKNNIRKLKSPKAAGGIV